MLKAYLSFLAVSLLVLQAGTISMADEASRWTLPLAPRVGTSPNRDFERSHSSEVMWSQQEGLVDFERIVTPQQIEFRFGPLAPAVDRTMTNSFAFGVRSNKYMAAFDAGPTIRLLGDGWVDREGSLHLFESLTGDRLDLVSLTGKLERAIRQSSVGTHCRIALLELPSTVTISDQISFDLDLQQTIDLSILKSARFPGADRDLLLCSFHLGSDVRVPRTRIMLGLVRTNWVSGNLLTRPQRSDASSFVQARLVGIELGSGGWRERSIMVPQRLEASGASVFVQLSRPELAWRSEILIDGYLPKAPVMNSAWLGCAVAHFGAVEPDQISSVRLRLEQPDTRFVCFDLPLRSDWRPLFAPGKNLADCSLIEDRTFRSAHEFLFFLHNNLGVMPKADQLGGITWPLSIPSGATLGSLLDLLKGTDSGRIEVGKDWILQGASAP